MSLHPRFRNNSATATVSNTPNIIRHRRYILVPKQAGIWSLQARLHNLTLITQRHSIQSRPSIHQRYMFCSALFPYFFLFFSLIAFGCVEGSMSGGANMGRGAIGRCATMETWSGICASVWQIISDWHNDNRNLGIHNGERLLGRFIAWHSFLFAFFLHYKCEMGLGEEDTRIWG